MKSANSEINKHLASRHPSAHSPVDKIVNAICLANPHTDLQASRYNAVLLKYILRYGHKNSTQFQILLCPATQSGHKQYYSARFES